ncbi:MAG TPA: ROK family transcriptional regulator [Candidatus Nanopelagicales bacterium]|nr:ROK family transcriptional regulator [Candidatus Nanopelagicales bacterium]
MPGSSPARPALLRSLNDRTVLAVLLSRGPSSRADVVGATGLSKPTVAEVLARLEEAGLVVEAGETVGRRGPNGRLHDLAVEHLRAAAVSVTPSRLTCALLDVRGEVLARVERPRGSLPRGAGEATRALVVAAAQEAGARPATVREVVISVPGSYDPALDQVRYADRIPDWIHPGIAAAISSSLGRGTAVTLDNDVNLALVAERGGDVGAPGSVTSLLWLGAGVGLATDLAGTLYRGVSGGAGEIGYVLLPGAGGGHSELQDLVGAAAVRRLAREHGVPGRSAEEVVQRAAATRHDVPGSAALLDELARRLALGLSVIVAVLDPGAVVLGGAVGRAGGDALAGRTARALRATSRLRCAVVASTVEGDPAFEGAQRVAVDRLAERLLSASTVTAMDTTSRIPAPRSHQEVHAR